MHTKYVTSPLYIKERLHMIKKMYVDENKSLKEISLLLGCCSLTVKRKLEKMGVEIKQRNGKFQEKYYINEEFFENWSEDMAYLLGYIASDGCIRPNKYELKIKSIDYELLEHAQQLLKTNFPIKKEKNTNCYSFSVYSKKIVSDLQMLGITPKKSCTLKFPKVPDDFFWDFLRGEIDGDGCVFPPKENSISIGMNIVGSKFFLMELKNKLIKKINCKPYALNYNCKSKNNCTLPIYCKSAYDVLYFVYKNEKYGLSRKKNLALKVLSHYDSMKTKICKKCGSIIVQDNPICSRKKHCNICLILNHKESVKKCHHKK